MKEHIEGHFPSKERKLMVDPVEPVSSDLEIWQSFKSGNKAAFIFIYETYFDSLYSYGTRITKNEELVKDGIHDVFFDLRKNCESIGDTNSIKFYLFKCLKRKILKELNSWLNRHETFNPEDAFEITFSHEQVLIDNQLTAEQSLKIKSAIKALSPRKREAIYYLYYEGMSYEQIKELMNLSNAKSARDLVYKALRSMRKSIGFLPLFFMTGMH